MNNEEIKKQLVKGTGDIVPFTVIVSAKEEGGKNREFGPFQLRVLSIGELTDIGAMQQRGIKAKARAQQSVTGKPEDVKVGDFDLDMDMEKITVNEWDQKYALVAKSLTHTGCKWTTGEVKTMRIPKDGIDQLVAEIKRISEADDSVLRPFRKGSGRTGIDVVDPNGTPVDGQG